MRQCKIEYASIPQKNIQEILQVIEDNDGYCPCRLEKTKDTLCMCRDFREMQIGICHCGIYEKKLL